MSDTRDTPGAMSSSVSLVPLYLARTLAAWGDRTWQFVGGMFMLQLGDSDTSLQANIQIASCLSKCCSIRLYILGIRREDEIIIAIYEKKKQSSCPKTSPKTNFTKYQDGQLYS